MIDQALYDKVDPRVLKEYIMKTVESLKTLEKQNLLPEINGKKVSAKDDFLNAVTEVRQADGTVKHVTALDLLYSLKQKDGIEDFIKELKEKGAETGLLLQFKQKDLPGKFPARSHGVPPGTDMKKPPKP